MPAGFDFTTEEITVEAGGAGTTAILFHLVKFTGVTGVVVQAPTNTYATDQSSAELTFAAFGSASNLGVAFLVDSDLEFIGTCNWEDLTGSGFSLGFGDNMIGPWAAWHEGGDDLTVTFTTDIEAPILLGGLELQV